MLITACGNSSKSQKSTDADSTTMSTSGTIDMHNAENALDYTGTYTGVFPAADCPGIETSLTINANKTFTQHFSYIDRKTSFDEKGTYMLEGNILTLKEDGGGISYYRIEENKVRKLDADKKAITGEMADNFILSKK